MSRPAVSERQREQMRQWFKQHPDYYRQWTKSYQNWRDEMKAQGVNVKGNSRPRTNKNQLAYGITITDPLQEGERYVREQSVSNSTASRAVNGTNDE